VLHSTATLHTSLATPAAPCRHSPRLYSRTSLFLSMAAKKLPEGVKLSSKP